ncbi:MAG: hypothetical protein JNL73_12410, partial [Anaerolineales bacterium]|nr:hypothetical protein [Anaerolineales bacterium]
MMHRFRPAPAVTLTRLFLGSVFLAACAAPTAPAPVEVVVTQEVPVEVVVTQEVQVEVVVTPTPEP